jgi:hypothetical protein
MMQIAQGCLRGNHMWLLKGLHVSAKKANNMCKIRTNANQIKKFVDESTIQSSVNE